jgi:hypothetical protein
MKYNGATSGTTTVNATAIAGTTTLTLPAATDTLVGKATTDTFTNKTFDANGTGNSISNIDLTADITGTSPVANGGTGATTLTDGGILLGSGTGAVTALAALADGEMIVGDGTTDPAIESGATLRTSIGVGTGDSPQFTAIELGHATDTSITRVSAGKIAVEGVNVVTTSSTDTLTNKTVTDIILDGGITEEVFAIPSSTTPELDPSDGTIQTWTLTGNSTPTEVLAAGESITLMIDDGTAYTITWPTMTWVNNGGSAPTLATSGYTVVVIWQVSTTLYGALVGDGT